MAISIARLRRWFATVAILVCLVVVGFYFHARHRVQNALKQVPEKLNIQVQQSAEAFTISKSLQGRTLFKLQASKAVQFKQGGHVELHDVMITIYGKDASRFDQIYGKQFNYDQQSGNVSSQGEVSIDLQANPEGATNPDQSTPRELKDPIHLKTTNLVFNQKSGDAWTSEQVEFHVPQLSGSAVGAKYTAGDSTLTLQSKIRMTLSGAEPMTISADHALLTKAPRQIVLQQPRTQSATRNARAEEATLFLRENNTLDHAIASRNVVVSSGGTGGRAPTSQVTAAKLEVEMGGSDHIQNAVFSGDVHFTSEGRQRSEGSAGRATLSFGTRNTVRKIHAEENVRLVQHQNSSKSAQDVEVTSPIVDVFYTANRLARAETSGPPQIRLLASKPQSGTETQITADKFVAKFDSLGQLSQVHGAANARVISSAPAQENVSPDRVSTSDTIDAYLRPGTGVESLVQQGHFAYRSGTQQAFAERGRYTPADQMLVLTGAPRIVDAGMETTARTVRLNRTTGVGFAQSDVKTTYNDLKPQPNGALLASSDPIHVTADSMTARNSPAIATYSGNVRLWQDANLIEAPKIQFQKDQRTVIADSNTSQKVSTLLTSTNQSGKATQVHLTADHFTYTDAERRARYQGSVVAQSTDVTVSSKEMDVYFLPKSVAGQKSSLDVSTIGETPLAPQSSAQASAHLDKIIASGAVVITQPNRHATGDKLTYTASDDKFVLTGGPPAVVDAEHGRVTGASLTLFRGDDRILVEGNGTSPAVTETQVDHTR